MAERTRPNAQSECTVTERDDDGAAATLPSSSDGSPAGQLPEPRIRTNP